MLNGTEKAAPRILIVDDDAFFRSALTQCLSQSGYEPIGAENSSQAQQLILLDEFQAIISDIRMPGMSGVELLNWIKTLRSTPVILMTGFHDLIEAQQADSLGAAGLLAKPFRREEILALLQSLRGAEEGGAAPTEPEDGTENSPENRDDEFCKLGIDEFVSGKEIKFEIYIRLSKDKYVKIAHGGEDLPMDRIRAYKEKGIEFLYLRRSEFRSYVDFNVKLARLVGESPAIARSRKLAFVQQTSGLILNGFFHDQIDPETFDSAKGMVETAVSLIKESEDTEALIDALSRHGDHLYAHSVGVSLYAAMLGRKLGWHSPATITKLSLGGLLHDIGKKQIPREIIDKPRKLLDADEVYLLESHPFRGGEILNQIEGIPSDVIQIVQQHHEHCLGFGYPAHLKKDKIHPLARVVAVANEFCNLALPGPNGPGRSPADAVENIVTQSPEQFDPDVLLALARLFKLDEIAEKLDKDRKRPRMT